MTLCVSMQNINAEVLKTASVGGENPHPPHPPLLQSLPLPSPPLPQGQLRRLMHERNAIAFSRFSRHQKCIILVKYSYYY